MQSVVEVTGYITAKNELAKAYEQVRLSKEAAELGTFDMDIKMELWSGIAAAGSFLELVTKKK